MGNKNTKYTLDLKAGCILVLLVFIYGLSMRFAGAGVVGGLSRGVSAEIPDAELIVPDDCLAFYRYDPEIFDAAPSSFLPFIIQTAQNHQIIDSEFMPLFDGINKECIEDGVPFTLCLMNIDAEYDAAHINGYQIKDIKAVLHLESERDHSNYLSILNTILSHYNDAEVTVSQEKFALTGQYNGIINGMRFKAEGWEDWQTIEWVSLSNAGGINGGFIVGLGRGSVNQWLEIQLREISSSANHNEQTTILEKHRRMISGQPAVLSDDKNNNNNNDRSRGVPSFLEVFLNLDEARRQIPDFMAQGRLRQILVRWKLDNARNWMLHGGITNGKYLALDITWQSRALNRNVVLRRTLTMDSWPGNGDLNMPQPPGGFIAVFSVDFNALMEAALYGYLDTINSASKAALDFQRKIDIYHARKTKTFDSIWDSLQPYIILSGNPEPRTTEQRAPILYFELKDDNKKVAPQLIEKRLEALIELFCDKEVIKQDKKQKLYWLQHDEAGLIKLPCWGWYDRFLIGGWGAEVVMDNRKRLDRMDH